MSTAGSLVAELKREAATTRKILERIPDERLDWTPHERSWTFRKLASHIANLGYWMIGVLDFEEVNLVAENAEAFEAGSVSELVARHDELMEEALPKLERLSEEDLAASWTLKNGDHVIMETSRLMALRIFILNHLIHHRGQLSVYLRLCDVSVPAIYGPSADEKS